MQSRADINKFEAIVLTVLFCAGICVPLGKQLIRTEPDTRMIEAREPNAFPAKPAKKTVESARKYIKGLESYYNDHFGCRAALLRLGSYIKLHWFHISPSQFVEIGKGGWLFLKDNLSYNGMVEIPDVYLEQHRLAMERRQEWLEQRGIRYLYVITPNKRAVYPDYLPDSLNGNGGKSQSSQVQNYLAAHSKFRVVSLGEVLAEARARTGERVFIPSDTHWNSVGAYWGYREVIRRLQAWYPELKASERSEFKTTMPRLEGELARMIGEPDFGAAPEVNLEPLIPLQTAEEHFELKGVEQPPTWKPFKIKSPGASTRLRVVVLRDSFANAWIPYLPQQFSEITMVWASHKNDIFEKELAAIIEREKPDLFIEEHVERLLRDPPDEKVIFGGDRKP